MDILTSLGDALWLILTTELILFVLAGVVLGIALGILPGLGGIAGMSILIAVLSAYQDAPMHGIAMAIGMIAVIPTSDTFASVLLGIPGSSSSQATVLDGFPLAKQGKAAQALSSAFISSLFGGILGVVVLTVILASASGVIKLVGSTAQFMLALFGIALVGILSGRSLLKGFLGAGLGLFVGLIGIGELSTVPRFFGDGSVWLAQISDWFAEVLPQSEKFLRTEDGEFLRDEAGKRVRGPTGWIEELQDYFADGLKIALVGLALFALPEITDLLRQNRAIAGDAKLGLGWRQGFLDWWNNKFLALWNAFIGVLVGVVPGLGGSVVDWIAYGQTKAIVAARGGDTRQFGKGDIRGVIGPESANNAKEGGGLVPTLLLGLPGSGSMAIFLGILGLFGLETGADMFNTTAIAGENFVIAGSNILITGMVVTFFIAWTLMLGNLMGAGLCFGLSAPISRLTKIPFPMLAPFLLVVIYFAVFKTGPNQFYAFAALLLLAVLGLMMKRFDWSRPAFLIGFVLAGPMETKFNTAAQVINRSLQRTGTIEARDWVPIGLIGLLIVLIVAAGILVAVREAREARAEGLKSLSWREKAPPIAFLAFVTLVFAYMVLAPLGWDKRIYYFGSNINDAQLPHFLGLIFFPLSLLALIRALVWRGERELLRDEERSILPSRVMQRGLTTAFLWIAGYAGLIALLGHYLGSLAFTALLLGRLSTAPAWLKILLVAGCMALLTLLADLTNPRLTLGAVGRLVPDAPWSEPVRDYLQKPQFLGLPR